jgi:predicted ribosome quality control (RQC) complex YloA/Tae2 family protein
MSVDGRFIKFLAKELNQELSNGRIQKVSQISSSDFLWMIRNDGQNKNLYISLSTSNPRIHLIHSSVQQFDSPGGFCMFMRKHVEGGKIQSIQDVNHDRIVRIIISNVNDLGDEIRLNIYIEMFGRYANMIIVDDDSHIINAYKHIHPFEGIDRTIVNGAKYHPPKDDKIDPENMDVVKDFLSREHISPSDIYQNIRGLSPLIAKSIINYASDNFISLYESYQHFFNLDIQATMTLKKKAKFYFLDIFQEDKKYFDSLSLLLEEFYKEQTSKEKVKQIHKYLLNIAKNHINKYKNKLEKLTKDLKKANRYDTYRIKGDLIIQDQHKIKATDYTYTGFSYEINDELSVDLDRKLSVIDNANHYYKRYKKLKIAIKHINRQIILTKHQLNYFIGLKQQIESNHQYEDLIEIRNELIDKKYIPKKRGSKSVKKQILNYDSFTYQNAKFFVGKNNLQNNYLTHKFAKKNDLWFHVQNQSGSHVIVQANEINEAVIRHAANLAAYYSKSQKSGSVPVDYTQVKNIKKIPGELGSLVTYTQQKTIYIDPDFELIKTLKKG